MTPEDRERKRCALARDLYGPGSPCTDDPVIDALLMAKETIKELRAKLAALVDLDAAEREHRKPRIILEGERGARVILEDGVFTIEGEKP